MYPPECVLNEFCAGEYWPKANALLDNGAPLHKRDYFGKTAMQWVFDRMLTTEAMEFAERLILKGIDPATLRAWSWVNMSSNSRLANCKLYHKDQLLPQKLAYMALRHSPLVKFNVAQDDQSVFTLLSMCRAGQTDVTHMRKIMTRVDQSYTVEHVLAIVSSVTPYLPHCGDPLYNRFKQQNLQVPTLKVVCIAAIRHFMTWHHLPLHSAVQRLISVIPAKIVSELCLDHVYNGEWKAGNFLTTYNYITGEDRS